jgi:hypothetical protein
MTGHASVRSNLPSVRQRLAFRLMCLASGLALAPVILTQC